MVILILCYYPYCSLFFFDFNPISYFLFLLEIANNKKETIRDKILKLIKVCIDMMNGQSLNKKKEAKL